MYKSNTEYTNRYGDKYHWEPIKGGYKFHMTGNSLKYGRTLGDFDEELQMITHIRAFDPSGGPYVTVGVEIDDKPITKIYHCDDETYCVEVSDE